MLSPSTRGLDTDTKAEEYAAVGITEYWLLGLEAKTVTVYVLENGEYSFVALYRSGETACSETLDDLTVRVDDLFQKLEGAVTWWNSFFRIKMERGKDGN